MATWFKRIFLFAAVNILVIITISIVLNILGISPALSYKYGINYEQLAIFCLIWGMGGAFISLLMSRMMAKWMMGVKVIDPQTRDPELSQLVQMVHELARGARLPKMPEVGIYESPEVNAFATGPTKSRALVAVSTGLLHRMKSGEVYGVLGHEIAHVANGDMVTLTLIQGIVNAFAMFLSRIIAFAISTAMRSRDGDREHGGGFGMGTFLIQMVIESILLLFGSMVVAWFSRWREFRADAGGARYAGRDNMIAALERLRANSQMIDVETAPAMQSFKISNRPRGGLVALFSSHPPLEERIERLQMMRG